MINKPNLQEFLQLAKINTYASSGEGGEIKLKNGGKKFEYKKDSFCYQDIYFGFNPFIGQEIVFYRKKPIWAMNYYGRIISKKVSPKEIYAFLKKALMKVTLNKPLRGPNNFKLGYFEYSNDVRGDIKEFIGKEKIYYKNELIYKLDYHGGIIKVKD